MRDLQWRKSDRRRPPASSVSVKPNGAQLVAWDVRLPLDHPSGVEPPAPRNARARGASGLLVAGLVATYLVAAAWQIDLPGVYYDEAYWAPAAFNVVYRSWPLWVYADVDVGVRRLPIMLDKYIGAVKSYLLAPGFALFGPSPATLRAPPILLGAAVLVGTFWLARGWFGPTAGLVAVALLATDPTYVTYLRHDYGPVSLATGATVIGPLAGLLWWRTGGTTWLFGVGLTTGLAIYDKWLSLFIAVPAGLTLVALRPDVARRLIRPDCAMALAAGLLTGTAPLLWWLGVHHGELVTYVADAAGNRSTTANLAAQVARLGDLGLGMHGDPTSALRRMFRTPAERLSPWPLLLAAAAIVLGRAALVRRPDSGHPAPPRRILPLATAAIPLWVAASLACWSLTPGGGRVHHLFPLYVLTVLWVGGVLATAARGRVGPVVVAIVLVSILANLATVAMFHRQVAADPGQGMWSTATGELARRVARDRDPALRRYVMLDWGLFNQVYTLANAPKNVLELVWPVVTRAPGAEETIGQLLTDPTSVFVLHGPDYTVVDGPRQTLHALAADVGVLLACEPFAADDAGRMLIELCAPSSSSGSGRGGNRP